MRRATEQSYQERILAVLVHIQEHLDEPLPLDELARVACFSPFHFHRVFRGMVGEPVAEHIRRLRLERAARQLRKRRRPVTDIALEAGYEAPEAFTRAFLAMFGVSPSAYRRAGAPGSTAAATNARCTGEGGHAGFVQTRRGGPTMEVRIETLAPVKVAYVRHVGPFDTTGGAWQRLFSWAGPRGLLGPQMKLLTVWLDDPEVTPPEKLRGDVCITVSGDVVPEGEIGVREVAGGEYAVATHRGPYEQLGETYAHLCAQWAPRNGRELRDEPGFEVYLNNPQTTRPEDLLTDVYVPLETRRK
jgi:AraC family transcriptional regulator